MPLRIQVGLSRKFGLPNYGSVGATCAVDIELDPLVFRDETTLHARIREAFDLCRGAVESELTAHHNAKPPVGSSPRNGNGAADRPESGADSQAGADNSSLPLITSRQIDFLDHLARQIRPLGCQRLKLLAEHLYGRPVPELTARQGSQLIELLKELRAGTRSIEDLLPQAAA